MELSDYLRAMGRRFLILVIVPAVAAGMGYSILSREPTRFNAKAAVRLPVPTEAPTAVITQANIDFSEALTGSATRAATSQATGASRRALRNNLTVARSGSGRVVEVTFTTTRPAEAEAVVTTASRLALVDLLKPDVELKRKVVEAAKAQYDAARTALDGLGATGATLPADQYRQKLAQVSQLEVQLLQAQATHGTKDPSGRAIDNTQAINAFTGALATARTELAALVPLVSQARPAEDAVQTALSNLGTAERALDTAEAALASVDAQETITTSPVTKIDKGEQLLKSLAVIVAVAIVLAVAVLVLLELLAPSSRLRRGTPSGDDTSSFPVEVAGTAPPREPDTAEAVTPALSER